MMTVNERMRSLSQEEESRLLVLQELLATANQPGYGKRQQVVAQKLGIRVRSVCRLVHQLREEKIVSFDNCLIIKTREGMEIPVRGPSCLEDRTISDCPKTVERNRIGLLLMVSEGWVFRVKAYQGESLCHFLGKFRRANDLSHKSNVFVENEGILGNKGCPPAIQHCGTGIDFLDVYFSARCLGYYKGIGV
jgi:hypothetical protein